jgi:hypothetical protein
MHEKLGEVETFGTSSAIHYGVGFKKSVEPQKSDWTSFVGFIKKPIKTGQKPVQNSNRDFLIESVKQTEIK